MVAGPRTLPPALTPPQSPASSQPSSRREFRRTRLPSASCRAAPLSPSVRQSPLAVVREVRVRRWVWAAWREELVAVANGRRGDEGTVKRGAQRSKANSKELAPSLTSRAVILRRGLYVSILWRRSIASGEAALKSMPRSLFGFFSNDAPLLSLPKPCGHTDVGMSAATASQGNATHRPLGLSRRPQRRENHVELLHVALGRHERYSQHELGEDAAGCPDINAGAVRPGAEQQLGTSVPSTVRLTSAWAAENVRTAGTHRVTTWQVIRAPSSAYSRARPKSASFSTPSAEMSKLFGFISYGRDRPEISRRACSGLRRH